MDPLRKQLTDPKIARLLKVINLIRLYDRDVPGQVIATLLWVASHEGGHKTALEEDLNLSTASTSRNTDWLAKKNPILGRPALGLIVKEPDECNKRRVTLSLSSKGRDLIKTIKEILYE